MQALHPVLDAAVEHGARSAVATAVSEAVSTVATPAPVSATAFDVPPLSAEGVPAGGYLDPSKLPADVAKPVIVNGMTQELIHDACVMALIAAKRFL